MKKIVLDEAAKSVTEPWKPFVAESFNDYEFRILKVEGEFFWHNHPNSDEFIIVQEGEIKTETEKGDFILKKGDALKIPKGLNHISSSTAPSKVLAFVPKNIETKKV